MRADWLILVNVWRLRSSFEVWKSCVTRACRGCCWTAETETWGQSALRVIGWSVYRKLFTCCCPACAKPLTSNISGAHSWTHSFWAYACASRVLPGGVHLLDALCCKLCTEIRMVSCSDMPIVKAKSPKWLSDFQQQQNSIFCRLRRTVVRK